MEAQPLPAVALTPDTPGPRLIDWAGRAGALALAVLVVAYPARAFLGLDGLPIAVRAIWPLVVVAAMAWPRASLLAWVGVAPLLPIVPHWYGWPSVSLAECWLAALVVAACLDLVLGRRRARVGLPAEWLLLVVVAVASLAVTLSSFSVLFPDVWSLVASVHEFLGRQVVWTTSQRHVYSSIPSTIVFVEGLVVLWLVLSTGWRDRVGFARSVLVAAAAGAAVVSVQGVYQWWTRSDLLEFWVEQDPDIVRINATFADVNALGSYLAAMVVVIVGVAYLRKAPAWRWSWRAAAALSATSLVFTASRAAWAAGILGVLLYLGGMARWNLAASGDVRARRFRLAVASAVLLFTVAVAGAAVYGTVRNVRHGGQRRYVDTALYTLNVRTPMHERLKGRWPLWQAAASMVQAHPVFGVGIGRYYKDLWAYAPDRGALIRPQENAHNYFLQVAAELGIAGLAVFLALLAWGFAGAWRAVAGGTVREDRRLALAAASGCLAFTVTLLTGHPLLLPSGQFTLWPLVGGLLLLAPIRPNGGPGRVPAAFRLRVPGRERGIRIPSFGTARRFVLVGACIGVAASVPFRAAAARDQRDLSRLVLGAYDPESTAGGEFRWTTERVRLFAPATARTLFLPIRSLAPVAQEVVVVLEGEAVDRIRLADHEWHELRYLLPRRRDQGRFLRIELRVEPTWHPPDDSRALGVQLGAYGWTP